MNRYIPSSDGAVYSHRHHAQVHHQQANMYKAQANTYLQQAEAHQKYAEAHHHHANMHQQRAHESYYLTQPITAAYQSQPVSAAPTYGYSPSTSYLRTHPTYAPIVTAQAAPLNEYPQMRGTAQQPVYDERHTAYAGYVSPAALVFHGQVSPQAQVSIQEYQHPYTSGHAYPTSNVSLAPHTAHATENHTAMHRGYRM